MIRLLGGSQWALKENLEKEVGFPVIGFADEISVNKVRLILTKQSNKMVI